MLQSKSKTWWRFSKIHWITVCILRMHHDCKSVAVVKPNIIYAHTYLHRYRFVLFFIRKCLTTFWWREHCLAWSTYAIPYQYIIISTNYHIYLDFNFLINSTNMNHKIKVIYDLHTDIRNHICIRGFCASFK